MNKFEKKHKQRPKTKRSVFKKDDELSTLELWQAHLRALRRASSESSHKVEVIDTTEQTSSTIVVNMPHNPPAP